MAEIKITKNELRNQQSKLNQLRKYLPTLQLKKALLQAEVAEARLEIVELEEKRGQTERVVDEYASLFTQKVSFNIADFCRVKNIYRRYENIAGAEVPFFERCDFAPITYDLFETPVWLEAAIEGIQTVCALNAHIAIVAEKLHILEHELREVTIRVNLFEKILIPRCEKNIKKIKVFLGDQQLAAVSQAKVAKAKILERYVEQEEREEAHAS